MERQLYYLIYQSFVSVSIAKNVAKENTLYSLVLSFRQTSVRRRYSPHSLQFPFSLPSLSCVTSVPNPKWQNIVNFSNLKIEPPHLILPSNPLYGLHFSALLLTKYD